MVILSLLAACGGSVDDSAPADAGTDRRVIVRRDADPADAVEEPPDCSLVDAPPGLGIKLELVCDTATSCHLRCVTYVLPRETAPPEPCEQVCSISCSSAGCAKVRCCSSCDPDASAPICEPIDD